LRRRRQNQRGEGPRLRLEIMQAAMRILDRAPASELSLRMVAREAGVTPPAVYAHFPDAKTMMTEIAHECWRQLADEMSRAARAVEGEGAFASLRAQVGAYVHYAMGRPSRYQLLFAAYPVDAETSRYLPRPTEPVYLKVLELMDRLRAEGGALPTEDSISAALLVLTVTHGRIAFAHLTPDRPWSAPAEIEKFVLNLLERLFRPDPASLRPRA
jgi:AcrR family transcriptional regulator